MTKVEIVTIIIYIVVYAIVFIIQKSQFDKQKSIMEKYEKMFSIINIDEIEKYVNMKEKSLKLEFENRDKELTDMENRVKKYLGKAEKQLIEIDDLKIEMEETNLMKEETNELIVRKKKIDSAMIALNTEEFDKIYQLLFKKVKSIDETELSLEIEKGLLEIQKEFLIKKSDLLK